MSWWIDYYHLLLNLINLHYIQLRKLFVFFRKAFLLQLLNQTKQIQYFILLFFPLWLATRVRGQWQLQRIVLACRTLGIAIRNRQRGIFLLCVYYTINIILHLTIQQILFPLKQYSTLSNKPLHFFELLFGALNSASRWTYLYA